MILVTVGTQLPFDRLVKAVDDWASRAGRTDVVAQIGDGEYAPTHIEYFRNLPPEDFQRLFREADYIVGHAGIGTILAAIELAKPILVMPRRAAQHEHRTDHQVATGERFERLGVVTVADDQDGLRDHLDRLTSLAPAQMTDSQRSEALQGFLQMVLESAIGPASFDGVLCFGGEDWWYHNRGHYDMQMMREASKRLPVLYVNSIGVRSPRANEGKMFLTRIRRKLRSFARGLTRVRPMFSVFSPVTSPGLRRHRLGRAATVIQIRRAMRRTGMKKPLLWVAVPSAADILDQIPYSALIYQRTDRFEEFDPDSRANVRAQDRKLKAEADVTLFASHYLLLREGVACKNAMFVDHGVDYAVFRSAPENGDIPNDVRPIPEPRVGFVGGLDSHTFDPELFASVAGRLPHISFVLVGASSLPPDWFNLENVHMVGRKPYDQVASYMGACDALIMPWRDSEWIRACNPVKLKEYLATGKPVISTYFPELDYYQDTVTVANDPEAFAEAIKAALSNGTAAPHTEFLSGHTWEDKFKEVWAALNALHGSSTRV